MEFFDNINDAPIDPIFDGGVLPDVPTHYVPPVEKKNNFLPLLFIVGLFILIFKQ